MIALTLVVGQQEWRLVLFQQFSKIHVWGTESNKPGVNWEKFAGKKNKNWK